MHRRGPAPGVFMSGHLRFCFAAFLLLAGFSTSPASSNPFSTLFNTAPGDATAPAPGGTTASAPAEQECLRQPGKATDGQHWVYRIDGPRKCWFQVAERSATVKKLHQYAAKQRFVAPEENEAVQRRPKAVVGDALAELLPPAPAETSQLTPPVRELKVVDADSVNAIGAAAIVPLAPVVAKPVTGQLTPDYPMQRSGDVETLLATAPPASDTVASTVPAAATAFPVPIAEANDQERGWTATCLGVLLIALGLIFLLTSSVTLRGHRAGRAISRSKDRSAENRRTFGTNVSGLPVSHPPSWLRVRAAAH
jgi:hypothetical protein